MAQLASFPNVKCKISGLMTEAMPYLWKVEDFKPYIQHVIYTFAPSRILFGNGLACLFNSWKL
ncbi:amidohydrolase family protein [Fredinandcohnia onubensis]|uniref:amidohydrolase family protein n=1 Tax=Fredinandcohnia onubensis TaxID=1571209 RepID=UPI000C0BDCC9|nr:amidohydrolase family protein [Fredinandcohnia onubensis]